MPDKRWEAGFYSGVLAALAIVYAAGEETTAEEIVRAVGSARLLSVAKQEDDMCLKDLRKTVRFLSSRRPALAKARGETDAG